MDSILTLHCNFSLASLTLTFCRVGSIFSPAPTPKPKELSRRNKARLKQKMDGLTQRIRSHHKTRAIFRAIYKAASARTEVTDVDGKTILSDAFPIRRGVVQGDITSPIYFILALDLILKEHDNFPQKGVDFGGANVHTLGYADDAALLDSDKAVATARVTSIATGSRKDADMEISPATPSRPESIHETMYVETDSPIF